jgi:hypothetical protein
MNTYLYRGVCTFAICVSGYLAAQEKLPEITAQPIKTVGEVVDCSKTSCGLSREQLSALTTAASIYRADMPKVEGFHFQVSNGEGAIEVTVFPDHSGDIPPYSVPGGRMAVTYIFDSNGVTLKNKYFNR